MSITIIRSNRKTLALQVNAEGEVLVRAPRRALKRDIDRFVAENESWLQKQLQKREAQKQKYPPLDEDGMQALVEQARTYLPKRVLYFSQQMGLVPTGITITLAKTRFGSCSPKNRICFSALLMRYPPEAVDYVVVHELAHIRHKDHGTQFYGLIESVLPDYKARRALLKE